jgi:hypothetical protein
MQDSRQRKFGLIHSLTSWNINKGMISVMPEQTGKLTGISSLLCLLKTMLQGVIRNTWKNLINLFNDWNESNPFLME